MTRSMKSNFSNNYLGSTSSRAEQLTVEKWITALPKIKIGTARKLIFMGGTLEILLDEKSTVEQPIWRATILDANGQYWALSGTDISQPRKLDSVQRVYQVARNLSVAAVKIPVISQWVIEKGSK